MDDERSMAHLFLRPADNRNVSLEPFQRAILGHSAVTGHLHSACEPRRNQQASRDHKMLLTCRIVRWINVVLEIQWVVCYEAKAN